MTSEMNIIVSPKLIINHPQLVKIYALLYDKVFSPINLTIYQSCLSTICDESPSQLKAAKKCFSIADKDFNFLRNSNLFHSVQDFNQIPPALLLMLELHIAEFFRRRDSRIEKLVHDSKWQKQAYQKFMTPYHDWDLWVYIFALWSLPHGYLLSHLLKMETNAYFASCAHHDASFATSNPAEQYVYNIGANFKHKSLSAYPSFHMPSSGIDERLFLFYEILKSFDDYLLHNGKVVINWTEINGLAKQGGRVGINEVLQKCLKRLGMSPYYFSLSEVKREILNDIDEILRAVDLSSIRKLLFNLALNIIPLPIPNPVSIAEVIKDFKEKRRLRFEHKWFIYFGLFKAAKQLLNVTEVLAPPSWYVARMQDDTIFSKNPLWLMNKSTGKLHEHNCGLLKRLSRRDLSIVLDRDEAYSSKHRCKLCAHK
jgi:hypothetical protein